MSKREVRPGVWELRAEVEPDPATGRRRFTYETFKGGVRAAGAAERKLQDKAEQRRQDQQAARAGTVVNRPVAERTVGDALAGWWADEASGFDDPDRPRGHIDTHLMPKLGDVTLWRLRGRLRHDNDNPDLVCLTAFYEDLRVNGRKTGAGPLEPSYVARIHSTLRSSLQYAVARGWLPSNPAADARLPKAAERPTSTPPAADMAVFLQRLAVEHPMLYTFALVMGTGGRRVENAPLRWGNVDLEAGELRYDGDGLVRRMVDGREVNELRTGETRKRRKRTLELDDVAFLALLDHRRRCEEYAAMAGVALPDSGYVFSGDPDGATPYAVSWSTRAFNRAVTRARRDGLTLPAKMRLYDVRHFMATMAKAAGISSVDIAYRMGNSARTVDARYAHPVSENDRRIAELMSKAWTAEAPLRRRRAPLRLVTDPGAASPLAAAGDGS